MRQNIPITISLLFLVFAASCASIDPAIFTEKQMEGIVILAREKALNETNGLTDQEKSYIKDNHPTCSYYIISGSYAQYSFSWGIDASNEVTVFGEGNIFTLEGSKVEKLKIKK